MKDLALVTTIIMGGSAFVGGFAGNRIAKHYGKSQLIGTILGIAIGYASLIGYIRMKQSDKTKSNPK